MIDGLKISVFFASKTFGGTNSSRIDLHPVCHSCERKLGLRKDEITTACVPAKAMPLIFSAELAAKQLGIEMELIDVTQFSIFQKLRLKLQGLSNPCIRIGNKFINGTPTKDEIVEYCLRIIEKI